MPAAAGRRRLTRRSWRSRPTAHMHVGWISTFLPPADGVRPRVRPAAPTTSPTAGTRAPLPPAAGRRCRWGSPVPRWADDDALVDVEHARATTRPAPRHRGGRGHGDVGAAVPRSGRCGSCGSADELAAGGSASSARRTTAWSTGIAAVELASLLLDRGAEGTGARAERWRPRRRRPGGWGCWPTRPGPGPRPAEGAGRPGSPGRVAAAACWASPARRGAWRPRWSTPWSRAPTVTADQTNRSRRCGRWRCSESAPARRPGADQAPLSRARSTTCLLAVCPAAVRDLFEARGEPRSR